MSHRALGPQFSAEDEDLSAKIKALPSVQRLRRQPGRRDFSSPPPPADFHEDGGFMGGPKLYHGTRHDFSYDMVLPSSAVAKRSKWKEFYDAPEENWRKDRVFTSEHERSAWNWAQGTGRPRVHEVELKDPKLVPGAGGEYHGEHAMVKRTHWAPHPKDTVGGGDWVQPTISPIDWKPYGGLYWQDKRDRDEAAVPAAPKLQPAQFAGQGKLF